VRSTVGTAVIQIEELLQIVEGVGLAQRVHVFPRQGDLVAFGEAEQQFGFQRAFQMQMQFCLGQVVEPFVHSAILVVRVSGHSIGGMAQPICPSSSV